MGNTNRACFYRSGGNRGFTLIEIILVVVIILTLASVVGPRLVNRGRQARISTTRIQIESIRSALQNFEINASRFPTTSEGLEALVKRPSVLNAAQWPDSYLERVPKDSFGNAYRYVYPAEKGEGDYDLISAGPDGHFGTDDDISNHQEDSSAGL